MKFLVDTRLLLWAAHSPGVLSARAAKLLDDKANTLYFSATSLREMTIQNGLRRDEFEADPRVMHRGLLDNGYIELPVTGDHALVLLTLPPIHKDPFDRILVAQAIAEGITLLTSDRTVARYPAPIECF
ncbi:type II toxin-antitoxin system VapC family toxin [Pseudochelatococcus sp. B33]